MPWFMLLVSSRVSAWEVGVPKGSEVYQPGSRCHKGRTKARRGAQRPRSGFVGALCAVLGIVPRTLVGTGWQDHGIAIPLPSLTRSSCRSGGGQKKENARRRRRTDGRAIIRSSSAVLPTPRDTANDSVDRCDTSLTRAMHIVQTSLRFHNQRRFFLWRQKRDSSPD